MVDLRAAFSGFADRLAGDYVKGQPIPGSGLQKLSLSTKQAAVAATAPMVLASGAAGTLTRIAAPIIGRATSTAAKRTISYTAAHPINALKIGTLGTVTGIVGINAIKTNPQIVTKGAPLVNDFLKDTGTLIGDVSKSPSFSDAYGHLKGFVAEHPIGSALTAVAGAGAGGLLASRLYSDYKTREAIQGLGEYTAGGQSASQENMAATPETQGWVITPDETPTKKAVKSTYRRRSKAKNINRSPITIKNYNIMGVGRHG